MTDGDALLFQLERALALADCVPDEHPKSITQRHQDLVALIPRLRADMDATLARQMQNAHPKARRIARYFDEITQIAQNPRPDYLAGIYDRLALIEDDWQVLTA